MYVIYIIYYYYRENANQTQPDSFYLYCYIGLIPLLTLLTVLRSVLFIHTCVSASKNLHASLLNSVFSAPINTYFDVTPVGRILNRFSKDLDALDSLLPDFFLQNVQNLFHIVAILLVCIVSTPYFVIIMSPICKLKLLSIY